MVRFYPVRLTVQRMTSAARSTQLTVNQVERDPSWSPFALRSGSIHKPAARYASATSSTPSLSLWARSASPRKAKTILWGSRIQIALARHSTNATRARTAHRSSDVWPDLAPRNDPEIEAAATTVPARVRRLVNGSLLLGQRVGSEGVAQLLVPLLGTSRDLASARDEFWREARRRAFARSLHTTRRELCLAWGYFWIRSTSGSLTEAAQSATNQQSRRDQAAAGRVPTRQRPTRPTRRVRLLVPVLRSRKRSSRQTARSAANRKSRGGRFRAPSRDRDAPAPAV
jgi:hypothetical protein